MTQFRTNSLFATLRLFLAFIFIIAQQLMQQASRNRAKRTNSDTTGGSATPTLLPVPMDESIEKMGESAEYLKYNVSVLFVCLVCLVLVASAFLENMNVVDEEMLMGAHRPLFDSLIIIVLVLLNRSFKRS